jgi:hypothetical protein
MGGSEQTGVFILGLIIAAASVWLVIRLRRNQVPRLHQVLAGWTPIVRELVARGIEDRSLLVGALANWELQLEPPVVVRARLPAAVATVADALNVGLATVQGAVIDRAAQPEPFLADLKALRPKLDGLPGVVAVGVLWPDEASVLGQALLAYRQRSGLD